MIRTFLVIALMCGCIWLFMWQAAESIGNQEFIASAGPVAGAIVPGQRHDLRAALHRHYEK